MKTKVCSKCGRRRAATLFSPRPERPCGRYSCCKKCKKEFRTKRYHERRIEDPVALWLVNALNWSRHRARKQSIEHTLSATQLSEALNKKDKTCVYCDVVFNFRRSHHDRSDSPTIDRLDPKRGYSEENVAICCYRCNAIKNNATFQELRQIADRLESLLAGC